MKSSSLKTVTFFSLALMLFAGSISYVHADPGLRGGSYNNSNKERFVPCAKDPVNCGFPQVYQLIKTVIDFLLLEILSPVAIIAIVFAGFKYVTAQGNPGEIKKAHDIFYYVVVGMVIAFAAWLIVNTILTTLNTDHTYNFLSGS